MKIEIGGKYYNKLYSAIENKVSHEIYPSEMYRLGAHELIEDEIDKFVTELLNDEKIYNKLVNRMSRLLINKKMEIERNYRNQLTKDRKLWKITKGIIPCLYRCGNIRTRTKEEVLSGQGNNFICKSCAEKHGGSLTDILSKTNVYKIVGIE